KKYGVNVTQAENYYSIALNLYNEGNYTGAISYLHMAMKNLANQMRTKPSVINVSQLQAEGIKMQLLRIEEFVNTDAVINSTYKDMIISQIKMALNNITQGNVSNAAKILTQIKEELMQISVNISNVAKEKVAKFIKNRFENDANKINKLFQDEFGNASSVYGNAQLTVTPVMELVENQLSKNATNLSIDEYSHLLIALNNLEGIVMTQRLSFVVNQTGRMNFIWPMLIKINVINASLQQASEIVQNNTTLSKAVNLMESSLNLTKYSIKEYTLGFDNVALSLINESIQEDKEAQNILSNTQLMMVNRLIMISN
ncbi:MAG: hypothetical protein RAK17_06885, partial [Caldisphaera sp.]|nr:hypothetical protein [Caldisphaera sp.]